MEIMDGDELREVMLCMPVASVVAQGRVRGGALSATTDSVLAQRKLATPFSTLPLLLRSWSWMRRTSIDGNVVYHYFVGSSIAAVIPFPQLYACMRVYEALSMIHSFGPVCKQCSC